MRHKVEKELGSAPGSRDRRRRVFVSCEGFRSEVDYFTALLDASDILGLNRRVDVIVLHRYDTDRGISDPARIIELTRDHMEYLATGRCSKGLFLSKILSLTGEEGRPKVKAMSRDPAFISMVRDGYVVSLDEAMEFACDYLSPDFPDLSISFDTHEYSRDEDSVCVVIDRDAGDERGAERYREFLESSEKLGFELFVTNPRFELWLLMHREGVGPAVERISEAANPSSALKKEMAAIGMSKKRMDFPALVKDLDTALANAEGWEREPAEMESRVGTNLPSLIDKFREGRRRDRDGALRRRTVHRRRRDR